MQLKNPIQKQVLKIYHDEFACFRLDDKLLKIYTYTHTHTYTHRDLGQVTSLSCTLIQPDWMEKNSVTVEKGTLNTQCMYNKNNLNTNTTLL